MSDEELKRQADSDWIDHTDSPYERYLELKLARAVKQRDDLLAACETINEWCRSDDGWHALPFEPPWYQQMKAAIDAVREGEPAKQ